MFADKDFSKRLSSGRAVDPKGKSLSSVAYLGKYNLAESGNEEFHGTVGLMRSPNADASHHDVNWRVTVLDGEIKSAIAYPVNRASTMWKRTGAEVVKPDGTIVDYPLNFPPEKPFRRCPKKGLPFIHLKAKIITFGCQFL